MMQFKSILLVVGNTNDDEATFQRAAKLAKANGATLTIINVMRKMPHDLEIIFKSNRLLNVHDQALQNRVFQLEMLAAPFQAEGVEVTVRVVTGTPFVEIIRAVEKNGHDLVIITAEGENGFEGLLFGRTSMQLMRKCPCPVWVIKPKHGSRFARILAAVDPDPDDPHKQSLNLKIMELAASLAAAEKSELHLIHAWHVQDVWMHGSKLPPSTIDDIYSEIKATHRDWLNQLLKQRNLNIPDSNIHLIKELPGDAIPHLARKLEIELIVMGTIARTGIPGVFIGNTAEKVLHAVDCSVLTVKPGDFISPVTA